MNIARLLNLLLPALVVGLMSVDALATPKPTPEDQTSSWNTAKVKGFDSVRLANHADWRRYKTFVVLLPELEFDKHWLREYRRDMTDRDETRIRETYTRVLQEALEGALNKDLGWQKVAHAGPDTLVVAPALTRFRITAPDLSFRPHSKVFVDYAGSARLTLTLLDGRSGSLLAELSDYKQTQSFGAPGQLKPTNRVGNLHDFKMLYKAWARRLGEFLKI